MNSRFRTISRAACLLLAAQSVPTVSRQAVAQKRTPHRPPAAGRAVRMTADPVDAGFFTRRVRPLLEEHCLGCHGSGPRLSGLDLRSRQSAMHGGTRGPALVPGDTAKSLLIRLVSRVQAPAMPPGGKLQPDELHTLRRWIAAGAPWNETLDRARRQVWWSFRPVARPRIPIDAPGSWGRNPIDAFLYSRLKSSGLTPSPPATRAVRIRRAYLDLTGLPPAPEEVEAFVKDSAPDAWERVVDRLLASPRYGERWGRHWLDLARYADSGGFEGDKDRPLAWRYRDYVIDSFNADKPYDLFLQEQLAGDELRPQDPEAIVATGYLACGPQDIVENSARTRANEIDDLVSTTGSVVLGLTIGCARCHDHKYDPIKQSEYYRLAALFAPSQRKEIEIPTPEERRRIEARNAELETELAPLRARAEPLRKAGLAAARKAGHPNPNEQEIVAALPETERGRLRALFDALKAVEARRPQAPRALAVTDSGRTSPSTRVHVRGDANNLGEEVSPGFLKALPGGDTVVPPAPQNSATTRRRLALAGWLVSPENPLTARVWMNRVWRQHFGRGLVETPGNFGINGELPSHPDLLDWLASTFREGGWRLKPIHRLILLSRTYQQASDVRSDLQRIDPQNRLYGRMLVRRLEAEVIRDSVLAVAGSLNLQMGGPPVYPPIDPSLRADTFQGPNWQDGVDGPETWRRSVYVKVKRSLLLPLLEVFDCPEITGSVGQRNITTTPLQALTLLNDPLIVRQSALFAARLQRDCPNAPDAQVDRAYRLAVGRSPTPAEKRLSLNFLRGRGAEGLRDFCHSVLNLNEFVYVP